MLTGSENLDLSDSASPWSRACRRISRLTMCPQMCSPGCSPAGSSNLTIASEKKSEESCAKDLLAPYENRWTSSEYR